MKLSIISLCDAVKWRKDHCADKLELKYSKTLELP